ncbi:MAG: MraY family glycosyltransferase [Desulfobacteraceae bacterium]|nr:MraY family glycosyltransferase [Desulfobacteraceae bacterium]
MMSNLLTAIISLFLLSLGATLVITPLIKGLANRCQCLDAPSTRKVHCTPMPRLGGVAIYLGVLVAFGYYQIFPDPTVSIVFHKPYILWLLLGSSLIFMLGLYDDVRGLSPVFKFGIQVVAAIIAFYGGIRIVKFELPWGQTIYFQDSSLFITIFWFLLVINAINLIDGLDGLAAGVGIFASLTLPVTGLMREQTVVPMMLAALAGACMGFLRYNFNPDSIFMGDSGSYFLGYMLAALSIPGTMKSEATVAILIPIIALGVPLMDTLLAPLRRFIVGKKLFQPDRNHIHHRLLQLGLSHRSAVLVIYAATVVLGLIAIIGIHTKKSYSEIFLLLLGLILFLAVRKLGYLEYFAVDKIFGYLRDVTDALGLKKERRTFLGRQIAIKEAQTPDAMWQAIVDAMALVDIDCAEIHLKGNGINIDWFSSFNWCKSPGSPIAGETTNCVLSLTLPLVNHQNHGMLHVRKDLGRSPLGQHTLRRIEQLRRSVVDRLSQFEKDAQRVPAGAYQPLRNFSILSAADSGQPVGAMDAAPAHAFQRPVGRSGRAAVSQ